MVDDENVVELRPKKLRGTKDPAIRAKGLARAKITNYKPATGNKADKPASGLPAMGDPKALVDVRMSAELTAPRRTRDQLKLAAMAAMEAVLEDVDVPAVAKALVAEKILNRLEGMPTQMQIVADMGDVSNLTADERAAEMADLERKLGRA